MLLQDFRGDAATGDFMVQEPFIRSDDVVDNPVLRLLAGADHAFINLEQSLTSRGEPADKLFCFRGNRELAGELARAGITVATIANNHSMDFGITGMRDNLAALRAAGVAATGAGETLGESLEPAVLSIGNRNVALLGISCALPNSVGAGASRPGLARVRIVTRYVVDDVLLQETPGISPFVETFAMPGDTVVVDAVSAAKKRADWVIVRIHWGVPIGWIAASQDDLATYQIPLGHALVDAGADAVLGHGPHVLHGVEIYKKRPIFYSLENFLFHQTKNETPPSERPYPRIRTNVPV